MDISIPENLEIKVLEESANHLILTIPPELSDNASELSDAHKILEVWKSPY